MQDKVVLVTGGARRVGAAICRRLHGDGARLVIHCNTSADAANKLADELTAHRPDSVLVVQADLLVPDARDALISSALAGFGRLDGLVNNASSFTPSRIGSIDEQQWRDSIGTNLQAPLFLCQAAAPALRASAGCIVNITDIHAERPLKNYVVYSIAKAGLAALTRSLALELGPAVRVNGVAPGSIIWPEHDTHFSAHDREEIIARSALQRVGDPADIAAAVKYLFTDAPYVTGQIIAVDGGRSIVS